MLLTIEDALGRRISILTDRVKPAGTHEVLFDGSMYPSGVFIVRLTSGARMLTRRVVLVK